jgi:hypothetical protein
MIRNGSQVLIARNGAVQYGVVIATISRLTAGKETTVYTVVYQFDKIDHEQEFQEEDVGEVGQYYNSAERDGFLKDHGGAEWAKQKEKDVKNEPQPEAYPAEIAVDPMPSPLTPIAVPKDPNKEISF